MRGGKGGCRSRGNWVLVSGAGCAPLLPPQLRCYSSSTLSPCPTLQGLRAEDPEPGSAARIAWGWLV